MIEINSRVHVDPWSRYPEILATASVRYGDVVIRDLRVVRTASGTVRVNFPDRFVYVTCQSCRGNIAVCHKFCHHCGTKQPYHILPRDETGRVKLHYAIAYAATSRTREAIKKTVLKAYAEARSNTREVPCLS